MMISSISQLLHLVIICLQLKNILNKLWLCANPHMELPEVYLSKHLWRNFPKQVFKLLMVCLGQHWKALKGILWRNKMSFHKNHLCAARVKCEYNRLWGNDIYVGSFTRLLITPPYICVFSTIKSYFYLEYHTKCEEISIYIASGQSSLLTISYIIKQWLTLQWIYHFVTQTTHLCAQESCL